MFINLDEEMIFDRETFSGIAQELICLHSLVACRRNPSGIISALLRSAGLRSMTPGRASHESGNLSTGHQIHKRDFTKNTYPHCIETPIAPTNIRMAQLP